MSTLVLLFCVLLLSAHAHATTYYVAKTGSDSNACGSAQTPSTAKLTITGGLQCLSPGDTLLVKPGVYNETLPSSAIPSGTANAWITIKSEVQYGAIIRPFDNGQGLVAIALSPPKAYLVIDGFRIDGTLQSWYFVGISTYYGDVHDILIQNNDVFGGVETFGPSDSQGISTDWLNYNLTIRANKMHDAGGTVVNTNPDRVPGGYGMYFHSHDCVVEDNEIYNNSGYGIHFYNSGTGGPYDTGNNIFRRNRIHHNGRTGLLMSSGDNNQAYNNVVYKNGFNDPGAAGVKIGGVGQAAYNHKVYNNTVYGQPGYGIQIGGAWGAPDGTIVRNNILWGNGADTVGLSSETNSTVDHNLLGIDPRFVNAAAADFHLQPGSPAIGAGLAMPGLAFRGRAPDLGALDSGAAVQAPPPAPRNLHLVRQP